MRPFGLTVVVLLTLLGIAPANAAPDGDVLKRFGLFGRLAVDCAAPASRSNPHLIYAISPEGNVTRTLRMDPSLDGTFPMRKVRLLAQNRLQHDETGRQSELTVTVAKIAGKFRPWRSVRADGTVLIANGKLVSNGTPTVAFTACRN